MRSKISEALLLALAACSPALTAGEFAIVPLRVGLDRMSRSAEVTIRNEDTAPLRMQIEAMSWRQDGEGKDRYEPADGLIYFPRALEIPPGESRIVRVGIRAAPVTREETYRLFIEQLPPASPQPPAAGATLRVLLRVGVPVFVAPAEAERKAEIGALAMKGGQVQWTVANAGNVHFVADRVELAALARDGTLLHTQQYQERYFLAGVTKSMQSDIPVELCPQVAALQASVLGEGVDARRKIDVEPGACK
jgi:fimbrial chaperone protein